MTIFELYEKFLKDLDDALLEEERKRWGNMNRYKQFVEETGQILRYDSWLRDKKKERD